MSQRHIITRVARRAGLVSLRKGITAATVVAVVLGTASWAVASTTPTVAQEAASAGVLPGNAFCGKKPITLAVLDGFGVNAWSQNSYAAVRSEAAKCKNVKVIVSAGGGDLPTAISDINSAVTQGANAMTIIPDFGVAELPAIEAATKAGVKVVPWASDPGGTPGVDYLTYVDWIGSAAGTMWGNWMVHALHGKGNVIFLGGPAGNSATSEFFSAVVAVFAKHHGIKLLTGTTSWAVTNWDAATAQQVTSALLAKYPNIDGMISDYGTDADAALRAFSIAHRKPVPTATLDTNGLSCLYVKDHKSDPGFQIATISDHNWMGRVAARKAIAAAEGIANDEPSRMALPFFENTLGGLPAQCHSNLSPDFYVSNKLTPATIAKYGKAS
jgi:ribose transport system substrate-binding protein